MHHFSTSIILFTGVVIGETSIICQRVRIYQNVTLGSKSFPTDSEGEIQKGIPRHPVVEDDVIIYADVTFEQTQYQPPSRFEAGTGNIADAVGLGAAIDYVQKLGLENIASVEHGLLEYATQGLQSIPGVRLIGTAHDKASVASFVLDGYQTEEVGKALNEEGIAVRSGHHCAQPILRRFGVETTVRPSFAFYNAFEEIDRMLDVVRKLATTRR
jgi:selenocysteine lyase/cysteine desulfurase